MNAADRNRFQMRARVLDGQVAAAEARLNQLRAEREDLMRQMRDSGATYEEIADVLGVTRQRAWQKLSAKPDRATG